MRDIQNSRAIVFEFKYSESFAQIKRDAELVMQQIHDKHYVEELLAEVYETVLQVGIAFFAKVCAVRIEK